MTLEFNVPATTRNRLHMLDDDAPFHSSFPATLSTKTAGDSIQTSNMNHQATLQTRPSPPARAEMVMHHPHDTFKVDEEEEEQFETMLDLQEVTSNTNRSGLTWWESFEENTN